MKHSITPAKPSPTPLKPTTFVPVSGPVEAVRYTGSRLSFDAIWDWMMGDHQTVTNCGYSHSDEDPQDFTILDESGRSQTIQPGDWLVREAGGRYRRFTEAEFRSKYRPAD